MSEKREITTLHRLRMVRELASYYPVNPTRMAAITALLQYGDEDGNKIFPKHKTIAKEIGCKDKRTVLRALHFWRELGVLSWDTQSTRTSNIYVFHYDEAQRLIDEAKAAFTAKVEVVPTVTEVVPTVTEVVPTVTEVVPSEADGGDCRGTTVVTVEAPIYAIDTQNDTHNDTQNDTHNDTHNDTGDKETRSGEMSELEQKPLGQSLEQEIEHWERGQRFWEQNLADALANGKDDSARTARIRIQVHQRKLATLRAEQAALASENS